MSGDDMDTSMAHETSEPLLGDMSQDREIDMEDQSTFKKFAAKAPWKKSRRRRPSVSGKGFDVESMVCTPRKGWRRCMNITAGLLVALGIFQLIILIVNLVILLIPDHLHNILKVWGKPGHMGADLVHWPTDFSRDILPKPCHSHNDYWRHVPLYSALEAGCIGVEADIWLFKDELYVGHSISSLAPNRTLDSLYINPLLDILSQQNSDPVVMPNPDHHLNGVYDTTPEQTLIFLIDFKTAGAELFPYVVKALEPLRAKGYLSHQNGTQYVQGPITVVGTGNTPFDMVTSDSANPHRDIFFDAPLDQMYEAADPNEDLSAPRPSPSINSTVSYPQTYNPSNSFYASTSFQTTVGHLKNGEFSSDQRDKVRGFVKGAHSRGLQARFWDLPYWPISLRNKVWTALLKEGMDILNVDDLKGATRDNWDKPSSWSAGGRWA